MKIINLLLIILVNLKKTTSLGFLKNFNLFNNVSYKNIIEYSKNNISKIYNKTCDYFNKN